jgi:hypothetical protein
LGKHYTFGQKIVLGEAEYMEALNLADDDFIKAHVFWGLAHNYYFQRKFKESNVYATKYLEVDPNDRLMKLLKEKSDEAMRGVFSPKVIRMN